jgi:pSer/pThr/pTyr-binding forkhead associated (FHA) protein
MRVKFSVLGGPNDGLETVISYWPIRLGRDGERALPINDRWASRHHCELSEAGGRLRIRDLASKHGTFVNQRRIDECELAAGDQITIGLTALIVRSIEAAPISDSSQHVITDRPSSVGA